MIDAPATGGIQRIPRPTLALHLIHIAVALVAALLAAGLFAMTVFNNAHNEQMYVAATYLLTQGKHLYTDFAFVQMPYSVLSYALVSIVTGGGFFLLKAKLVNWLWMILAALLLFNRTRKSADGSLLALLILVLYFANYYLLRATIEASNYAMPLALSLLAYVLWLRGVEGRMRYSLATLLAGLALGTALGAKLYYATLIVPFAVAVFLYPRHLSLQSRIAQGFIPFASGGLVALLPVGYYMVRDWELFLFNNVGYHTINTQWRLNNNFTDLGWLYKWETARDLVANPNYLILELWLTVGLLLGWAKRHFAQHKPVNKRGLPAPAIWLAGTTSLMASLTAFTPSPIFAQYFAMPIPFLLLWMAELYGAMAQYERWVLARLTVICALVGILAVLPRHTSAISRLIAAKEPWSGIAAVDEARRIRSSLAAAQDDLSSQGEAGLPYLATLSPVLALEAGIPFYPELATGAFLLRVGDMLSPAERTRYSATSPTTLAALLDANPPGAILIGEEGNEEIPLRQYAETHGYVRADFALHSGELWLRPTTQ